MTTARNSRVRRTVPLLIAVCLLSLPAHAQYGGGRTRGPYLIYTAAHLNAIGIKPGDWDKHFKLMADLIMSATSWPATMAATAAPAWGVARAPEDIHPNPLLKGAPS